MTLLYLGSVTLHILAVIVWLGAMFFVGLVLVPVSRQPEIRGLAPILVHLTGQRLRIVGWACIAILIATGWFNVFARGVTLGQLASVEFWTLPFGQTLGLKLLLVIAVLGITAYHDFVIGPRATAALRAKADSAEAEALRAKASSLGRFALLLSLVVVVFGVFLVRGRPW